MSNLDVALRLRLINQLGGPAKDAKKELEGVGAAAKKLDGAKGGKLAADLAKTKTEAKGADAALQKVAAGAKKVDAAKADRLARDLTKTKTEALAGQKALAQMQRTLRQLDGSHAERLAKGLRNATAASERLARSLRRVREEARAAEPAGGGRLPPAHRTPARPPGEGGGGLPPAIVAGGKRLMGAVGLGYLGYRSVTSGVRTVVEQDKAWAEVRKKVNGSPEQLSALQRQLRAQARRYGMSIVEAFEQAASAGAAGIDINEIAEAVRTALMASKAWDTNAKETMQYMAQMKAAMGWNLDTLRDWADKVNALADASAASERSLVDAAKRSTAPGAAAGVDADTVLAITAAQISGGMPDEVASRWFTTFASKLAGANAGTKKQKEALSKILKIDPKVVAKGMEKDARATIMEVLKRFNELSQQQRIEFGVSFFGQEWWDETARAAKVIPEITRMFEILNDKAKWSGSMQSNLDITLSTIASHWERVKAAASETANEIDKVTRASSFFNDVTEAGLEKFEQLLNRWQSNPELSEKARERLNRTPIGRILNWLRGKKGDKENDASPPAAPAPSTPAAGAKASAGSGFQGGVNSWEKIKAAHEAAAARNFSPVPPDVAAQARATMQGVTSAVTTEGAKAVAESRTIADTIKAIFNFIVTPTISPRLGGATTGGGAPTAPSAPAATPAVPGKGAATGGRVQIVNNFTINGAGKDGRQIGQEVARQLAKLGNSSGALFDTV